jgi:hypothetical protein
VIILAFSKRQYGKAKAKIENASGLVAQTTFDL